MEAYEIVNQVTTIIKDQEIDTNRIEKFQIMFMSMGEPMHNWVEVRHAIYMLNTLYPNADLLLSTIGVDDDDVFASIITTSKYIAKVGLQFSIHKSTDAARDRLIPYSNKMPLTKIRDAGMTWYMQTGRKPYLNYCVDGTNNTTQDYINMSNLFSPLMFNLTFSVVCSPNETMKAAGYKNIDKIKEFTQMFAQAGYNTRIFDPAGQDDIGGGCGQLWYVQKWIKERADNFGTKYDVKKTVICTNCICSTCKNNQSKHINGVCNECSKCTLNSEIDDAQRCRDYIPED